MLSFPLSQWAESCSGAAAIAGSDAGGVGGPRQEGARLLPLCLPGMGEEQSESVNWETLLRNAERSVEEGMEVMEGCRGGWAVVTDPPLQESEGRVADRKSRLNRAVIELSISGGTRWAGLVSWEGRSKAREQQAAVRARGSWAFLQGRQRCLSGKSRIYLGMKEEKVSKVQGCSCFAGAELKSWGIWVPLEALSLTWGWSKELGGLHDATVPITGSVPVQHPDSWDGSCTTEQASLWLKNL